MLVSNVNIYDLDNSIIASGYPMRTFETMDGLDQKIITDKDIRRAHNLSHASDLDVGAHEQFMTGIRVSFDLRCTNKMWVEAERYRFLEFVSSQSTMHRITKFELDKQYNEYVDPRVIEIMQEKVTEYNAIPDEDTEAKKAKYLEILYTNPAGFELTARMTTNYRCLKNIYYQRRNHRLPEWREFCKWIETLPYFNELIGTKAEYTNEVC